VLDIVGLLDEGFGFGHDDELCSPLFSSSISAKGQVRTVNELSADSCVYYLQLEEERKVTTTTTTKKKKKADLGLLFAWLLLVAAASLLGEKDFRRLRSALVGRDGQRFFRFLRLKCCLATPLAAISLPP